MKFNLNLFYSCNIGGLIGLLIEPSKTQGELIFRILLVLWFSISIGFIFKNKKSLKTPLKD